MNCNDLAQVCGLCHAASIPPVLHCANCTFCFMFFSPRVFLYIFFLSLSVFLTLQDFELITEGVEIIPFQSFICPLCAAELTIKKQNKNGLKSNLCLHAQFSIDRRYLFQRCQMLKNVTCSHITLKLNDVFVLSCT